jgi:predicted AlkP superfamily phosphohydrolase/phosphomutase
VLNRSRRWRNCLLGISWSWQSQSHKFRQLGYSIFHKIGRKSTIAILATAIPSAEPLQTMVVCMCHPFDEVAATAGVEIDAVFWSEIEKARVNVVNSVNSGGNVVFFEL